MPKSPKANPGSLHGATWVVRGSTRRIWLGGCHPRSSPMGRSQSRETQRPATRITQTSNNSKDFSLHSLDTTVFKAKQKVPECAKYNETTRFSILNLFLFWSQIEFSPHPQKALNCVEFQHHGARAGAGDTRTPSWRTDSTRPCQVSTHWTSSAFSAKNLSDCWARFVFCFKSAADIFHCSERGLCLQHGMARPVCSHLVHKGSLIFSHPAHFQSYSDHKNKPQRKETITKVLKKENVYLLLLILCTSSLPLQKTAFLKISTQIPSTSVRPGSQSPRSGNSSSVIKLSIFNCGFGLPWVHLQD